MLAHSADFDKSWKKANFPMEYGARQLAQDGGQSLSLAQLNALVQQTDILVVDSSQTHAHVSNVRRRLDVALFRMLGDGMLVIEMNKRFRC